MSTKAPEEGRLTAERILPPEQPRAPSGTRSMWVGIVVALLIGGLIGYLIGWNVAPTETETVTVTEQVTETVAPPAYTAGTEAEAFVAFDGASCTYSGPAEVNARTMVAFTYAATVADSTLIVWQVEPGITYEQVVRAVNTRSSDEPPPWLVYWEQSAPSDARQQTLSMLLIPGTYVVSCATNPDTSTGDVLMSTMIRAVGS